MLNKDIRIVLDPGHSGTPDPGAIGENYTESDIAYHIADMTKDILESAGATVLMTKSAPNDPDSDELWVRTEFANSQKATLFVSIHLNAAESKQANGTETYCFSTGGNSEKLATLVQNQLVACLGLYDRGVKTARYQVLRETEMPTILTEVCFISNPREETFIIQNIEKAAKAIAQGIIDYFYV